MNQDKQQPRSSDDSKKAFVYEDKDSASEQVIGQGIKAEYKKDTQGRWIGLFVILVGVVLILLRISGSVTWHIDISGLESELLDASPGLVVVIVGFLIIYVTRAKTKIRSGKGD
ncbi:MAG: hypothetical protein KAT85_01435 [candidate division Zixibacteria bacterium]|nr:hypothetical protein [candidate division Zixibacteria bacterium]